MRNQPQEWECGQSCLKSKSHFQAQLLCRRAPPVKMQTLTERHLLWGKGPAWCCGNEKKS